MTDTCGLTSCKPFAKWDRNSSCWKTSEATSLWALTLSSLTLPTWGGLHDGELCEHPTPARLTNALDYSSLPTPAVNDMGRGKTVAQWDAWTAKMQAAHGNGNGHGKSLEIEALRLLPTPTTEHSSGGYNPAWGHGMTLLDAAKEIVGQPGATTAPQSPDGSTPSDDPHPHLLSLDGLAIPA